jgi:hypothetical protein
MCQVGSVPAALRSGVGVQLEHVNGAVKTWAPLSKAIVVPSGETAA